MENRTCPRGSHASRALFSASRRKAHASRITHHVSGLRFHQRDEDGGWRMENGTCPPGRSSRDVPSKRRSQGARERLESFNCRCRKRIIVAEHTPRVLP
jgi:hypothetical protein